MGTESISYASRGAPFILLSQFRWLVAHSIDLGLKYGIGRDEEDLKVSVRSLHLGYFKSGFPEFFSLRVSDVL